MPVEQPAAESEAQSARALEQLIGAAALYDQYRVLAASFASGPAAEAREQTEPQDWARPVGVVIQSR